MRNGQAHGHRHEAIFYDPEALVEPIRIVRNLTAHGCAGRWQSLHLHRVRAQHLSGQGPRHAGHAGPGDQFEVPDMYGRPWAKNWEKYFEQGMKRPEAGRGPVQLRQAGGASAQAVKSRKGSQLFRAGVSLALCAVFGTVMAQAPSPARRAYPEGFIYRSRHQHRAGSRRVGHRRNAGRPTRPSSRSWSPTTRAASRCRSCRTPPTASGCAAMACWIPPR